MMIPRFQICIDADDPPLLNRFWAAAVGYVAEDHHDQVTELLAAGHLPAEEAIEIDGRMAFATAAASRDPGGVGPRLLFQHVPEPKTVMDRIHVDLPRGLDADGRGIEVERLVALGATKLWDGQQGPSTWVTLADPEGNEFCIS